MEYESSEAIIFNLVDYSNTSKIISFLSSSRGKLSCIAKGIKRKNNPWKYFSDRLNLVEIEYTWKPSRDVQTLTEMSLINNYPEIKKDIFRQTLASLTLECTYTLTPKDEKIEESFLTIKHGFELINNSEISLYDIHNKIPLILWKILKIYGFEPQLNHCSNCGSPINTLSRFSFNGGAVCQRCPYHTILSIEESSALHSISRHTLTPDKSFPSIPNQILPKLVTLICDYIRFHSEQDLRSLNVYKEIFSKEKGEHL